MQKYLVLGGSGYLGRNLLKTLEEDAFGTYLSNRHPGCVSFNTETDEFDALLDKAPEKLKFVVFLHGIANPDRCARDPAGTRQINVLNVIAMMKRVFDRSLTPVYLSSDYVFDGTAGFRTEDDALCPTTEYGRQKAEVESWLQGSGQDFIVVRSSKIISGDRNTHSVLGQWINDFVKGSSIKCATDQIFSPMHVEDVSAGIIGLAEGGHRGVFNVCGSEAISRYDLCAMLKRAVEDRGLRMSIQLSSCHLEDIPFVENRPLNTSLSNEKLVSALGQNFRTLEQACEEAVSSNFPSVPG